MLLRLSWIKSGWKLWLWTVDGMKWEVFWLRSASLVSILCSIIICCLSFRFRRGCRKRITIAIPVLDKCRERKQIVIFCTEKEKKKIRAKDEILFACLNGLRYRSTYAFPRAENGAHRSIFHIPPCNSMRLFLLLFYKQPKDKLFTRSFCWITHVRCNSMTFGEAVDGLSKLSKLIFLYSDWFYVRGLLISDHLLMLTLKTK